MATLELRYLSTLIWVNSSNEGTVNATEGKWHGRADALSTALCLSSATAELGRAGAGMPCRGGRPAFSSTHSPSLALSRLQSPKSIAATSLTDGEMPPHGGRAD